VNKSIEENYTILEIVSSLLRLLLL